MSAIFGMAVLLFMGWVIVRLVTRPNGFNVRRAGTRASSLSSANGLLILAAVNVATLGFDVITQASKLKASGSVVGVLVPILMIGAIVLLVVNHSIAETLVAGAGLSAALVGVALDYGITGLLAVLMFSMFMLVILGFLRGLT